MDPPDFYEMVIGVVAGSGSKSAVAVFLHDHKIQRSR
jgi:hypothetical protein